MNSFDRDDFDFSPPNPLTRKRQHGKAATTVIIPDCDTPCELASTERRISELFERGAKQVSLLFAWINQMPPTSGLQLAELLQRKPQGTTIVAEARAPVIGSGVLVFLGAERRCIRPTAWIYFPPARAKGDRRDFPPWLEGEEWKRQGDSGPDLGQMDYRTVLRLMDKHLPVRSLAGTVLTPAHLAEYCILDPELQRNPPSVCWTRPLKRDTRQALLPGVVKDGQKSEQRVWFIARNSNGRFTLQGGFPLFMMAENPDLRQRGIQVDFATKEELLQHTDALQICESGDVLIMDGDQVVRR